MAFAYVVDARATPQQIRPDSLRCARAEYAAGDYRGAALSARLAVRSNPVSYEAHALIGWSMIADARRAADRRDALIGAEAAARACIRIRPTDAEGHLILAWIYLFRGSYGVALDRAQTAERLDVDGAGPAACLSEIRRLDRAHASTFGRVARTQRSRPYRGVVLTVLAVVALVGLASLSAATVSTVLGTPGPHREAAFADALNEFQGAEAAARSALFLDPAGAAGYIATLREAGSALATTHEELSRSESNLAGIAAELDLLAQARAAELQEKFEEHYSQETAGVAGPLTPVSTQWQEDWKAALARWEDEAR